MSTKALPEFQEFLRARKIVPDRKVPFYGETQGWKLLFAAHLNTTCFSGNKFNRAAVKDADS